MEATLCGSIEVVVRCLHDACKLHLLCRAIIRQNTGRPSLPIGFPSFDSYAPSIELTRKKADITENRIPTIHFDTKSHYR